MKLFPNQVEKFLMDGKAVTGFIIPDQETIPAVMLKNSSADVKQVYNLLVHIESLVLQFNDYSREYQSESVALEAVRSGRDSFALATRRVLKEEVVQVATRGEVFPPKTTRHVIPVRPLFINVPLKLLSADGPGKDVIEKNKILDAFLRQRRIVKVRGHTTLDRFYEEDYLYLFT